MLLCEIVIRYKSSSGVNMFSILLIGLVHANSSTKRTCDLSIQIYCSLGIRYVFGLPSEECFVLALTILVLFSYHWWYFHIQRINGVIAFKEKSSADIFKKNVLVLPSIVLGHRLKVSSPTGLSMIYILWLYQAYLNLHFLLFG